MGEIDLCKKLERLSMSIASTNDQFDQYEGDTNLTALGKCMEHTSMTTTYSLLVLIIGAFRKKI